MGIRPKRNIIQRLGFIFFGGLMAAGYYYNLTFIQLGLVDLGRNGLGLDRTRTAGLMAVLALLTCVFSLAAGWLMNQRGWGKDLPLKLRLAFLTILVQTGLTFLVDQIDSEGKFLLWLVFCSAALGMAVPVTFSLTVDFIPRRERGMAAALITGGAYLAANLIPSGWTMASFAQPLRYFMPLGVLGLGLFAFLPNPLLKFFAAQQSLPEYRYGRYHRQRRGSLMILILLMFGVFFTDSLGFLRLLETPRFMDNAWQSSDLLIRLLIGLVHLGAALVGGVLYRVFNVRELFYWIFGIFALTHLMYSLHIRLASNVVPLAMTILYAVAVSLYTVVNFALWADLSTSENIGWNTALGVALSGWTATFLSTALAIWMQDRGIPLARHINITDSIAMLFFLALIFMALVPADAEKAGA